MILLNKKFINEIFVDKNVGLNMSVSTECKPIVNDVIYFIENCCIDIGIDDNEMYEEEKVIDFFIGDKVYFLDWFDDCIGENRYTYIKFKDENGKIFSVIESYFVTEDIWEGLKNYFQMERTHSKQKKDINNFH